MYPTEFEHYRKLAHKQFVVWKLKFATSNVTVVFRTVLEGIVPGTQGSFDLQGSGHRTLNTSLKAIHEIWELMKDGESFQ